MRFAFTSADERAVYRCRIDRRKWNRCTSPIAYRLGRGKHRFRVRAVRGKVAGPATKPVKFRVVKARKS